MAKISASALICSIIVFALAKRGQTIIAYDCDNLNSKFTAISLTSSPNCTRKSDVLPIEKVAVQVLQRKSFDTSVVTSCLLTFETIITKCGGFFSSNMLVTKTTRVQELTKEACTAIHTHLLYIDPAFPQIQINVRNGEGSFVGSIVGSNQDGKCKGGTFSCPRGGCENMEDVHVLVDVNIKISKETASVSLKDRKLSFPSGYSVEFDAGKAFDPIFGSSFWEVLPTTDECQDRIFVVYEGTASKIQTKEGRNRTKTLYFIEDDNDNREFLIEATAQTTLCGQTSWKTQSLLLFIVESSNQVFKHKIDKSINPLNFNQNLFLSMKISQLNYHVGMQMNDLYQNILYEMCLSNKKIIDNVLSLAVLSPREFAYSFFKLPGLLSFIRSDVLYIASCTPVNVTHRVTKSCTSELPVYYINKEKFISPRSRILVDTGEIVPCSVVAPNTYQIEGNWFHRINGDLILAKQPEILTVKPASDWFYKSLDSIVNSGLYSEENIQSYHKVVTSNLNLKAQTANLINYIAAPSGFSITRAFSLEDFDVLREKIQLSVWGKVKGYAFSIGNITSIGIGLLLIIKIIKFIANTVLNCIIVNYAFGLCSTKIFLAFWNHFLNLALHNHNIKEKNLKKKQKQQKQSNEPECKVEQNEQPINQLYPTLENNTV